MLIFTETFMVGYMYATMVMFVAGFIATEIDFRKRQEWKYL